MKELIIIKIGGNIIDNDYLLLKFLDDFSKIREDKILIHGGGKLATELSSKLGIETKMVDGRRITDDSAIRIVAMTYAGLINKRITALLQSKKCNAIGMCGVDAGLIPAIKRPIKDIDYGWVGDIQTKSINKDFFQILLNGKMVPVIAPLSCDAEGNLLNVNADTVAQSVAEALSSFYSVTLIYCFEKNGLLKDVNDPQSIINDINLEDAEELKRQGLISGGMIPKIDNSIAAIKAGVKNVIIGNAENLNELSRNNINFGTRIHE